MFRYGIVIIIQYMKLVILAGGHGTRMGVESKKIPKPMIEIGGIPIICHIMNRYSLFGINDFIICGGHKFSVVKKFFKEISQSGTRKRKIHESFNVRVVNTGENTMTGGRLKRIDKYLDNETFCFTYGDTLNDLNIEKIIKFHKRQKTLATVTACKPNENFGILNLNKSKVIKFQEKPKSVDWVNGGYFVLEPQVLDYIKNDSTIWENEPMKKLVKKKELSAYKHTGFYQPMDTINEKNYLEKLWNEKKAPWKT
jgi:glucose-1-phosphate cytidylyltransferase